MTSANRQKFNSILLRLSSTTRLSIQPFIDSLTSTSQADTDATKPLSTTAAGAVSTWASIVPVGKPGTLSTWKSTIKSGPSIQTNSPERTACTAADADAVTSCGQNGLRTENVRRYKLTLSPCPKRAKQ